MNFFKTYRIPLLIILVLFSCSVYSYDEEIKKRFNRINELTNFEVSFKQVKTLKEMNFTIKSSGTLKVSKPSNIVWKVTQPSYLEVNIDPGNVTILSKDVDGTIQKQAFKYNNKVKNTEGYSSLLNLMSLLGMEFEQLVKEYDIINKGNEKYQLTPKTRSDILKNILVQLGSDHLIKDVELLETSGDTIQILFQGYKISK